MAQLVAHLVLVIHLIMEDIIDRKRGERREGGEGASIVLFCMVSF